MCRWAYAGVWGRAPPGVVRCPLGVGGRWSLRHGTPFLRVGPGARRDVLFLCAPVPVPSASWPLGGFLLPRCVAPGALSLWAPACHLGRYRAPLPECPSLPLALPLPVPFPFPVSWWWWGGGGGADGPGLGVGGLEALAEGSRGVGEAEALDRVPEESFPCRLQHDDLPGGLAGVSGVRVRTSSKVCTMCTPSRLPAPPAHFTQQRSSCKAGADHQASWAGAGGGEGSQLEVLEWREEDVDMRRWQAWWRLGERERRWRGLGVEDGYGLRGERKARWGPWGEGSVDMGRQWCAWQRLGERERRWRGLGVGVAYGRRGEREARWSSWGGGIMDMGQRWRAWWCLG